MNRAAALRNGSLIACGTGTVAKRSEPPLRANIASKRIEVGNVVKVKSSQTIFTLEEVSNLTGICLEHLLGLVRTRHLGCIVRAAEAAGAQAERLLFSLSDLMIVSVLHPRCEH